MRSAIWFLSGFAALWGIAAIVVLGLPSPLMIVPPLASAAILAWAQNRRFPERAPAEAKRVGRLIGLWSVIEIVLLFVVSNLLVLDHHSDMVPAAAAIIVGLHFLPLARGIPAPLYWMTGATMIAVGGLALLLPLPAGSAIAAIGSAAILWITAILLVRRGTTREG